MPPGNLAHLQSQLAKLSSFPSHFLPHPLLSPPLLLLSSSLSMMSSLSSHCHGQWTCCSAIIAAHCLTLLVSTAIAHYLSLLVSTIVANSPRHQCCNFLVPCQHHQPHKLFGSCCHWLCSHLFLIIVDHGKLSHCCIVYTINSFFDVIVIVYIEYIPSPYYILKDHYSVCRTTNSAVFLKRLYHTWCDTDDIAMNCWRLRSNKNICILVMRCGKPRYKVMLL